jgi:hypothetical protein
MQSPAQTVDKAKLSGRKKTVTKKMEIRRGNLSDRTNKRSGTKIVDLFEAARRHKSDILIRLEVSIDMNCAGPYLQKKLEALRLNIVIHSSSCLRKNAVVYGHTDAKAMLRT